MRKPNAAIGPLMALGSMTMAQIGAAVAVPVMLIHGSFGISSMRLAWAALITLLLVRPDFRGFTKSQWKGAFALGAAMAFQTVFYLQAVTLIPVGPAITIDFLGPLAVATASLRGAARFVLPCLALAGVLAMTYSRGGWLLAPAGLAFAGAAAIAWAAYIVCMRHVGQLFSAQQGLCLSLIVAAVVALGVAAGFARRELTWSDVPSAAWLAVLSPLVPFSLEMMALRRLPMGVFSILMSLEPAIGTILGYAILRQTLSARQMGGVLMVMAASIVAIMFAPGSKHPIAAESAPVQPALRSPQRPRGTRLVADDN
jgi:inner membrane transporter RhtA